MGRGSRTLTTLSLNPVPPSAVEVWLTAFAAFELKEFHLSVRSNCTFPYPDRVPRFVVVEIAYLDSGLIAKEAFSYYTAPEYLLKDLVASLRSVSDCNKFLVEYHPSTNTFNLMNLLWSIIEYWPDAALPTSPDRRRRIQAIVSLHNTEYPARYDTPRFACLTRDYSGRAHLVLTNSFAEVVSFGGGQACNETQFEAFYDLDVSDQPVPIRFSVSYTDETGNVYSVDEPLI